MRTEWGNRSTRFALAVLAGFFAGLFALPLACGGLVLVNGHRLGTVEAGGPAAVLGGLATAAVVGAGVALWIWRRSGPQ